MTSKTQVTKRKKRQIISKFKTFKLQIITRKCNENPMNRKKHSQRIYLIKDLYSEYIKCNLIIKRLLNLKMGKGSEWTFH